MQEGKMKNFNDFLIELNRFEKKTGIDTKTGKPITKGGTAKDDKAYQSVAKKYAGQMMGGKQKKKVKAEKPGGGGKYLKMQDQKKQQQAKNKALDAAAKKAGYNTTQDYVDVQAVRKGGLGT